VLVHQDMSTPMAVVVDVLYDVGARDEDVSRTGFTHLFEPSCSQAPSTSPITTNPCSTSREKQCLSTGNPFTTTLSVACQTSGPPSGFSNSLMFKWFGSVTYCCYSLF
jgi:hypothetical protein